jgi:hypothetical protein
MKVSHTSSEYQQGLDGGEISGDDLAVSKSELDRIREDHGSDSHESADLLELRNME